MQDPKTQLDLPLECYDTGELVIHPMSEAVAKLCQTDYGFLAPLNRIIWNVEGRRGWNDVYEIAGEKPMKFGFYTYIYHAQPYTIADAEALINNKKELNHELFIAWAARFNLAFRKGQRGQALPKALWPFRYVKTFVNGNGPAMRAAYQMWDNRSSFVIAGVDRDQVSGEMVVDWGLLWREVLRKLRDGAH